MRECYVAEARGVAQNLAVPHGFTLVIGGTLAMLIGERGYPGPSVSGCSSWVPTPRFCLL